MKDRHILEMIKGTVVAFVTRFLGAGLNFLLSIVLARILGADGLGVYYLAFSILAVGTVFATMGIDTALLRYISSSVATDNKSQLLGVYRHGFSLTFIFAIIVATFLWLLSDWLAIGIFNEQSLVLPLYAMVVAIIPMSLLNLHSESLRAFKKIALSVFVKNICIPLLMLSMVGIFTVLSFRISVFDVCGFYFLASVVAFGLSLIFLRSNLLFIKEKPCLS